ncbi:MAG: hypothetical protein MK193_13510 [Lentisphaeria bacterium]|nr:hypothetical protein [Lentisphaeria bacterium]
MNYPIYDSIDEVPECIWENRNFVIEKYLQEEPELGFKVYYCSFMGKRKIAGELISKKPIVKFENANSDREIEPPQIIDEWIREYKIDFGRFDYLKYQGKYYLIDIN